MIFDPLHYLALLEQKPNALNQAAPLAGWELPLHSWGISESFSWVLPQPELSRRKRQHIYPSYHRSEQTPRQI